MYRENVNISIIEDWLYNYNKSWDIFCYDSKGWRPSLQS